VSFQLTSICCRSASVSSGRSHTREDGVAELGVQAAEALDHAHQLGIVHRDIKPGNLLLERTGRLWVTDFGLAHVQQSEANLTVTGQALGTPRYMSPEQALAKRVPIDHRTDVYSLGATLYELLTLRPAFPSEDRQELLRQIASEDPVRPRRLERAIPAELEIIVLKAMEKRPQDRYGTAQELADDLRRFLSHEPIRARRPSLTQRAVKWARRHQAAVVAAAAVSFVAATGLAIATAVIWKAKSDKETALTAAQTNYERAEDERQKALEAAAREAEERQRANSYFHEAADSLKDAQEVVDHFLSHLGQDRLSALPQTEALRRELLAETLQYYQKFPRRRNASPELRLAAARTYVNVGSVQKQLGEIRQAEENTQAGLALVKELCKQDSTQPDYRDVLAMGWENLGVIRLETNRAREGEQALRTAREIEIRLVVEHPDNRAYREHFSATCLNLGTAHARRGRLQQAEECFREALRQTEQLARAAPENVKYQDALVLAEANLGSLRGKIGDPAEAVKLLAQAVKLQQQVVDRTHTPWRCARLASLYLTLAEQQMKCGPFPEAFQTCKKALDLRYRLNAEFPTVREFAHDYAKALQFVGESAMMHGQDRAAFELLSNAEDLYVRLVRASPKREDYRHGLGECSTRRGWLLAASYNPQVRKPSAAIESAKRAVELQPDNGGYQATLGMAYYRAEKWPEALRSLEEAGKRSQPPGRIDIFFLAMTHWQFGHKEEARKWYATAEEWRRKNAPKVEPLGRIGHEAAQLLEIRDQQQEPRR
jgi:tetratricopeptide (TPR) repeat protein